MPGRVIGDRGQGCVRLRHPTSHTSQDPRRPGTTQQTPVFPPETRRRLIPGHSAPILLTVSSGVLKPGYRGPASKVAAAAEALRAGGMVIFPTETVYGLAASATSPEGVAILKNPPTDEPRPPRAST